MIRFLRTAKKLVISLLFTSVVLSSFSQAQASGGSHSGGGGFTPAEFLNHTRRFLRFLNAKKPALIVHLEFEEKEVTIEYEKFLEIYQRGINVKLAPDQSLYIGDKKVDLINTPKKNEVYSEPTAWRAAEEQMKLQVTIHELLGLAEIKDPNYELSETLARKVVEAGIAPFDPCATSNPSPLSRDQTALVKTIGKVVSSAKSPISCFAWCILKIKYREEYFWPWKRDDALFNRYLPKTQKSFSLSSKKENAATSFQDLITQCQAMAKELDTREFYGSFTLYAKPPYHLDENIASIQNSCPVPN